MSKLAHIAVACSKIRSANGTLLLSALHFGIFRELRYDCIRIMMSLTLYYMNCK